MAKKESRAFGETNEKDTKERLLLAAIKCIETSTIQNVTIRSIAKEANANSATINYYFGSKENLITKALEIPLNNFFSDMEEIFEKHREGDIKTMLKSIFSYTFEGIVRFPNLISAYFNEPSILSSHTASFSERLGVFFAQLQKWMVQKKTKKETVEINMDFVQIMHILVMSGTKPKLYYEFSHFDFSKPSLREKYINNIIEKYYGKNS